MSRVAGAACAHSSRSQDTVYKESARRPLDPLRNVRLIGDSMPLGFVEIRCNRINVLSMLGVARVCSNFTRFFVPGLVPEAWSWPGAHEPRRKHPQIRPGAAAKVHKSGRAQLTYGWLNTSDEVVKRQDELHARYLSDWQPTLCGGASLEVCQEPVKTQDGRGPKKASSAAA